MVSEALSCILNFKNFLGEGPPYPPNKRAASPPLVLPPPLPRVFGSRAHAFGMSNFHNLKGICTFPKLVCKITETNLSGRLKFLISRFGGELRYWVRFYILFIEKRKKYCFVPAKGTFNLSTDFCITVQSPNTSLF